ncbi:MAG: hypothetical protein HN337_02845 [Deltaproteobacteria bacterium]|jgi:hypothetical protein|nr:hypothetical protein [Deltaproteobacteria bacterium]
MKPAITISILLAMLLISSLCGAAEKFFVGENADNEKLSMIVSSKTGSQSAAIERNRLIKDGRLTSGHGDTSPDDLFINWRLNPGDTLLLNSDERLTLDVGTSSDSGNFITRFFNSLVDGNKSKKSLIPAVLFRFNDKSKLYGLIEEDKLDKLIRVDESEDTATNDIVNHSGMNQKGLLLIYVICPSDRNTPCDMRFKRNGRWLMNSKEKEPLSFKVFARSVREYDDPKVSLRTHINSDTPQGIYYIWGSVISRKGDRLPRIDLDAASTPINGYKYDINSYTLSQIVPEEALDDYWINEWPLAYSLGRVHIRIVSSAFENGYSEMPASSSSPTHGCINAGENQKTLLELLTSVGVLEKASLSASSDVKSPKQWSISPKIGSAFLILKDK